MNFVKLVEARAGFEHVTVGDVTRISPFLVFKALEKMGLRMLWRHRPLQGCPSLNFLSTTQVNIRMLCLEEIDVIILKHLLNDGRKSFTSIARECNTSTDVISKHFDKLTRSGVIVGATIQKNYPLFGYKGLALLLVNTVSQNLQETIKGLGAITAIRPPFRFYNCPYNVGIISIQSDSKDLSLFKEKLKKQIQIIESKLYFWVDVRNIPENLSFGCSHPYKLPVDAKNIRACAHYASDEKPKLDEIDMKIIDELNGAGRASFSEIANRIGSSTDTVNRRYNKLIQNGIIKVSIQVYMDDWNPRDSCKCYQRCSWINHL